MFFRAELFLRGKHHPGDVNCVLNPQSFASVSRSSLVDDSYGMSIKDLMRMAIFPWLYSDYNS